MRSRQRIMKEDQAQVGVGAGTAVDLAGDAAKAVATPPVADRVGGGVGRVVDPDAGNFEGKAAAGKDGNAELAADVDQGAVPETTTADASPPATRALRASGSLPPVFG